MYVSATTTCTVLAVSVPKVPVNARCAPTTSLFSRLIRAPVWVRVKNATGMRCTWRNARWRMSAISCSPNHDEK
jgi:hypothetical protein